MGKQKIKKTNAMRMLDSKKIDYTVREYEVGEDISAIGVAAKTGIDLDIIYKTLVLKGDKTNYIVACIPGGEEVNLKFLAKLSGNKKVEMILVRDLEDITGYIRGGCSPIGMKKLFPTYIHIDARKNKSILVSGGRRGLQIEITPNLLERVTRAKFENIVG